MHNTAKRRLHNSTDIPAGDFPVHPAHLLWLVLKQKIEWIGSKRVTLPLPTFSETPKQNLQRKKKSLISQAYTVFRSILQLSKLQISLVTSHTPCPRREEQMLLTDANSANTEWTLVPRGAILFTHNVLIPNCTWKQLQSLCFLILSNTTGNPLNLRLWGVRCLHQLSPLIHVVPDKSKNYRTSASPCSQIKISVRHLALVAALSHAGMINLWPIGCIYPMIAMNVTQHTHL